MQTKARTDSYVHTEESQSICTKILCIFPWIAIVFIITTIFVTGVSDFCTYDGTDTVADNVLDSTISHIGDSHYHCHWLFSIGWTVFAIITMMAVLAKAYLWNRYWPITRTPSMIVNFVLISIGLCMLVLMSWFPGDTYKWIHNVTACLGAVSCWFAIAIDTVMWFAFCKGLRMGLVNQLLFCLTAYSVALLLASSSVMIIYLYSHFLGSGGVDNYEHYEWATMFGLLLLFTTQSAHGAYFYWIGKLEMDTECLPLLPQRGEPDHETV